MFETREDPGRHGEGVPGPPWILGHRGVPRDAPENTLSSLARAIALGLDGIEYDVHGCATGEPVLIHDETLERTTDGHGPVARLSMLELARLDAGGWFHKRFRGEPLPLLEEALALSGDEPGSFPRHMIELKDPHLVPEVAQQVRGLGQPLPVWIASFHRRVCLEARDADLPSMLLALRADDEDLAFVRDERVQAYATAPGGWRTRAGGAEWPCERWSWSVDEPEDLLEACRRPLNGFNTNEPLRALATRALVRATPDDEGPYPLELPRLEVTPPAGRGRSERASGGEWAGRWRPTLAVRNPFGHRVRVALSLAVRGGAFEVEGLPAELALEPGERRELRFSIAGGSWSPRDDPLVAAAFHAGRGPGRPGGELVLDAPLVRVRSAALSRGSLRLGMLRERPDDPPASMTVRRRGRELLAWVEDAGGLRDLRAGVRIGSEVKHGGRGVRIRLPDHLVSRRAEGLPFSVGFQGREADDGPRRWRRWAGGLPYGLESGSPGRLYPDERA